MSDRGRWYEIDGAVFELFPGYMRGVVLAYEVSNGESPAELVAMLREVEGELRARIAPETLTEDPRVQAWREAYRAFGAKPSKFRPSMEAMARRVLRGQELPSNSRLVDIGNVVSLRYMVPVGGHAIDVVRGDLALRRATGEEVFTAFGSDEVEHPDPGEIVFVEGDQVLTRRWTWRQAWHTLVEPSTTAVEFNVDGLPPVTREEIEAACEEVIALVGRFCGGRMRCEVLCADHPRMALDPWWE